MAFDWTLQKRSHIPALVIETGRVVIADVSGFTFTVATKLGKVFAGSGVMINDGLIAYATTGKPTNGYVTFTRVGPIETSADTIDYTLFGQ